MKAVVDFQGVTHAVVLEPGFGFAGSTACGIRYWTVRLGTPWITVTSTDIRRMAEAEAPVDCMSCLVGLSAYDEACTEGSPPQSETA